MIEKIFKPRNKRLEELLKLTADKFWVEYVHLRDFATQLYLIEKAKSNGMSNADISDLPHIKKADMIALRASDDYIYMTDILHAHIKNDVGLCDKVIERCAYDIAKIRNFQKSKKEKLNAL